MSVEMCQFAFIADPHVGMNSFDGLRGTCSDKERLDAAIIHKTVRLQNVMRHGFALLLTRYVKRGRGTI